MGYHPKCPKCGDEMSRADHLEAPDIHYCPNCEYYEL